MSKTLILIRHGHRDNARRELDNGLTDKGRDQAKNIRRFFEARFEKSEMESLWLVSSPKKRCVETLQPLAKSVGRVVDIHPGLDEQSGRENGGALEQRVHAFLQEWTRSQTQITVACSHGDWIPLAIYRLIGLSTDPKKGSWTELEWDGGRAQLRWAIPSFKFFANLS